ncbi:FHA domain-containing protein [Microbacterium sp. NIBRBAC000506063]|uniref:FHA domain-containing protein FhaB/FipA n=1 Tax=Microbacterium sp. NIBRBAC000506063 TaxID=2734618 RepID=UPI001BB66A4B|nr:FHA domain-containing protein [Microbacterium sp. NIBRBAC000506063]QTV80373.1 FHA domain-containing protein [Microbacterium sp. NIBRBAC000506063]
MSELTLLLLRIGFLVLLWFFVFAVVYSLRADLFGVKVRKLPVEATAGAGATAPAPTPAPRASSPGAASGAPAALGAASRLVITSGPKAGLELPLGDEPMTIGRSSECGLVIRDDYTSSQHARLLVRSGVWTIQDLDSTNGTFHGKDRVGSGTPVTIGTPIKVGATTFELRA